MTFAQLLSSENLTQAYIEASNKAEIDAIIQTLVSRGALHADDGKRLSSKIS